MTLCRGKKLLSDAHPRLLDEWDYEKNGLVTPDSVSCGSSKKVYWRCRVCGHSWTAAVSARTRVVGTGCPACSGNVVTDRNRLSVRNPAVAAEWDYARNGSVRPDSVSFSSSKRAWWKCGVCGCAWRTSVNKRATGRGCPSCAGKVVTDTNRLSTLYPEISLDWCFAKNFPLTPDSVTYGSEKRVWWACYRCGHQWVATPNNRTNTGRRCAACLGKVATPRRNLMVCFPGVAAEWDHIKNRVGPDEVTPYSNKRVWWVCTKCGRSWRATVVSRVTRRRGCPTCANGGVSRASQEWLDEVGVLVEHREVVISCGGKKLIVDGFDPETNTVYEYFGYFWHGHPDFYSPAETNPRTHTTFGALYQQTQDRIKNILASGHNFIYTWGR